MIDSKEIYIHREIEELIAIQSKDYPILSVMGPRQSGKTKLIRKYFPELPYYDLEEGDNFEIISKNPNRFVRDKCMEGVIFDEFHYIPELTQILKTVSDELLTQANKEGITSIPTRFVLTGSHNYLFDAKIRETMVGRAALIKLLPLTIQETGCKNPFELMYKGGYPILHVNGRQPSKFFPAYIENYLDREVKTVHGIEDLRTFRKFMEICAFLTGNFFDYETVCRTLDLKKKTVEKWLTILYSSYIIFFAGPYHKSSIQRFANKDKLYFYDTGLCANLIRGIHSPEDIKINGDFKGKLFENLIFSEMWKKNYIQGEYLDPAYFWHVTGEGGYEVDMVIQQATKLRAVEIKASDKFDPHWFTNMQKHKMLQEADKYVVYTGPTMDVEGGRALNFTDLDQLFLR